MNNLGEDFCTQGYLYDLTVLARQQNSWDCSLYI